MSGSIIKMFTVILIALIVSSCSGLPAAQVAQTQESALEVKDSVVGTVESSQDQSGIKADSIDEVVNNNSVGEKWWVWLLIGFMIPQPRVIRWLF